MPLCVGGGGGEVSEVTCSLRTSEQVLTTPRNADSASFDIKHSDEVYRMKNCVLTDLCI